MGHRCRVAGCLSSGKQSVQLSLALKTLRYSKNNYINRDGDDTATATTNHNNNKESSDIRRRYSNRGRLYSLFVFTLAVRDKRSRFLSGGLTIAR